MMTTQTELGGSFTLPGTDLTISRMGYGAMQLAGPGVYGPPRDRDEAIEVLREAIESGVDHIDTSDFYGPHITNQIIKEALHPYGGDVVIVTKVGARRDETKAWHQAISRDEIISAVRDNLRNLGLDQLHVVNMRVMGPKVNIEEPFTVLAELQQQGLIAHLGVSNVTPAQYEAAKKIAPVVCVQNLYNVAFRDDDAFIQQLAAEGVPYMPYFPLGGFKPLQADLMAKAAGQMNATPMQIALAWLLHHAPNICLIPGTSSRAHLRENLAAASLELTPEVKAELDGIANAAPWTPPHR